MPPLITPLSLPVGFLTTVEGFFLSTWGVGAFLGSGCGCWAVLGLLLAPGPVGVVLLGS